MLVRIIGGHGGVSPKAKATSYLIDGKLLIDAGSIAEGTIVDEQIRIDYILLSHAHLDHTKDLAFLSDNCFGLKAKPFEVYAHKEVINSLKLHLMNDKIWPDFTKLPSVEKPTLNFFGLISEQVIQLGDYKITPVEVNHPGPGMGFIVECKNKSLVFTQDTGPTDRIWELAKKQSNLRAIFTEVSFPNHLQKVATSSQHHTPNSMKEEIKKMPPDVPIFLGHLKPNHQTKLYQEIEDLGHERFVILGSDDRTYLF
ncbi:MAG: 3',5'-cyclic-nucleotide phosphodiesterase [Oligoflexia bacterium]|nr:3',5'-cyclic-nucleotide phosphodiesterase [Oligoflexia bacterium]MBF0366815.1 3',5'-cyclic-nucleotide phosphodiesterase [Oligoflexia bacterium]